MFASQKDSYISVYVCMYIWIYLHTNLFVRMNARTHARNIVDLVYMLFPAWLSWADSIYSIHGQLWGFESMGV